MDNKSQNKCEHAWQGFEDVSELKPLDQRRQSRSKCLGSGGSGVNLV